MSLHEHQAIVPVTQLQELRTDAETYETFYQLYGAMELQRNGFSTILNRVLHVDETEDRSVHFVVAHANILQPPIRRQYDARGAPMHRISYNAEDIVVASTNGTSITEYDVVNAYGTYRAHLSPTDQQYNPVHERMELALASYAFKSLVRATFNMATGDGIVELGQQPCGWILSSEESTRIKESVLARKVAGELGHTAIAS